MIDDEFWQARSGRAGAYAQGYQGFDEQFATALQHLVEDWERETGQRADFTSFGRTAEQGREIWERSGHGKNFLAARPGHSRHEYDLSSGRYATAADIPRGAFLDYAHRNAGRYGLSFLSGDAFRRDPVHIQLAGPPKYGPSGQNAGYQSGSYPSGPAADPDPYALRSLIGLSGGGDGGGGAPFDISILRAIGGGPLMADTRGRENTGPSIGQNLFGGGGGDIIGGAYADSLGGDEVKQTVSTTLSSRGWAPDEIAAAIGNAAGESGFKSDVVNGIGAAGLWQFLGDRKQGLMNFASALGEVWTSPKVQALYLDAERRGESVKYGGSDESSSYAKAFSGGGAAEKTVNFARHVERPGEEHLQQSASKRINAALSFLGGGDKFADMERRWGDEWTQTSVPPSDAKGWSESAFPAFKTGPTWSEAAFPETSAPPASTVPTPHVKPAIDPVTTASTAPAEPAMPFWNEPDFNELQGGSKHAYHFDRDTGRGVYRTSKGKLIAYDESGMSSPIGERNVDTFVSRPSPSRGSGRRIEGGSTIGPASRDPVARALADAVVPWEKEKPATGPFSKFRGPTGGPPPSTLRDPVQITQLLAQLEATGDIYAYTTALKNYAEVLSTSVEVLDKMVQRSKLDTTIPAALEGGATKPAVDINTVLDNLSTMDPSSPEYFTALEWAEANTPFKRTDIENMVKGRKSGVTKYTEGGGIKWFNESMDNANARNVAASTVITELQAAPYAHDSLQYKTARNETIAFLNSIGVAETGKTADEWLSSMGL